MKAVTDMLSTDMQSIAESMFARKAQLNELLCNHPIDPTIYAMIDGINLWIASADNLDPEARIDAACDILKERPRFLHRLDSEIPTTCGCYCFYTEDSILYVGTSENIKQRISGRFLQCTHVAVIECDSDFRHQIECQLISALKPTRNTETRNRWEIE